MGLIKKLFSDNCSEMFVGELPGRALKLMEIVIPRNFPVEREALNSAFLCSEVAGALH